MVEKVTLTAKDAARYMGISYWLILELVKRKKLACITAGGRKLFRADSLDQWMTEQEAISVRQEQGMLRRIG